MARNTIIAAYKELEFDGYITAKKGKVILSIKSYMTTIQKPKKMTFQTQIHRNGLID